MAEEYNFSVSLYTTRSRRQLARLFRPPTWQVRMCSWTDYEITSTFAELVIEAESPILLHGWVADFEANAELILAPLRAAGVAFEAECYRADGELLRAIA